MVKPGEPRPGSAGDDSVLGPASRVSTRRLLPDLITIALRQPPPAQQPALGRIRTTQLRSGLITPEPQWFQRTISRRASQVLTLFQLKLKRQSGGYELKRRHRDLLTMQRRVHQGRRFLGRGGLRLDGAAPVQPLLRQMSLPDWVLGPCERGDHGAAVALLRDHCLDAWLGPLPPAPSLTGDHTTWNGLLMVPLKLAPSLSPPALPDLTPGHLQPGQTMGTGTLIGLMLLEEHARTAPILNLMDHLVDQVGCLQDQSLHGQGGDGSPPGRDPVRVCGPGCPAPERPG